MKRLPPAMLLCLLLPLLLSSVEGKTLDPPVVHTPLGQVQGKIGVTAGGVATLEYLGLPYGEPPVGDRRFLPPTPVQPWPNTFNATAYGNECSQVISFGPDIGNIKGKEDCLNLNIFVAKNWRSIAVETDGLLPVMVWIHGGALVEGSNQEGIPDPLVERGVMVVMINYRLGPLGFLTFGNNLVSGNMGIRDQLLALEWVKDNIESYGGDPHKVTIFGESAGGVSVHTHILSPLGECLYRSAIAQSGTAMISLLEEEGEREERFSAELAAALNCSSYNHDQEMLSCLQTGQSATVEQLLLLLSGPENFLAWWIVVDNYAEHPVLPRTPLKIMQCGDFKKIPYISGTMKSEGGFLVSTIYDSLDEIAQNWDSIGVFFTGLAVKQDPQLLTEEQRMLARVLRDMYTGNNFTSENLPALVRFFTHVGYLMPDQKTVSLMGYVGQSDIFNYQMSFKDIFSITSFFKPGIDFGPVHGDDNYYLFNDVYGETNYTEKEKQMSNIMAEYWTNFAKFSDPNIESYGVASSLPYWHPVLSTGQTSYLDLNLHPQMKEELDRDKEFFWQRMIWDHREGGRLKERDQREGCENGFLEWVFG